MDCDDVRGLFSDYYDYGSIAQELCEEISAHFERCPECAAEYDEYGRLIDEVRALPKPEPPSGFHDMLMTSVRLHGMWNKKNVFYRRFALAAAASLLFGFVLFSGFFTNTADNGIDEAVPMQMRAVISDEPEDIAPVDIETFDPEPALTLGGTGSRAWLFALIGGIIPLGAGLAAVIISGFRKENE